MKPLSFTALGAVLLVVANGCDPAGRSSIGRQGVSRHDFKASTNLTQTGEIPADIKSLHVINNFGSVRVTGTDGGQTRWIWKLTARARTEPLASEAAAAAQCVGERDGDALQLTVTLPDNDDQWSFTSDLEIAVSAAASVRTENSFGDMSISGLAGKAQAINQHGALELRDVQGEVDAQTSYATLTVSRVGTATLRNGHGRLDVSNVAGELNAETSFAVLSARDISGAATLRNQHGSIDLSGAASANARTSFGRLIANGIRGDATLVNEHGEVTAQVRGSASVQTSFASIDLDAGGPELECRNEHGSIKVYARSEKLTTLDARTSFGHLEVRLPAGLTPAIQARSTQGEIDSDFPVVTKDKGAFAGAAPGTPRLTLHNQHGDIRVVKE